MSLLQVMYDTILKMFLGYKLATEHTAVAQRSIGYHISTGPKVSCQTLGGLYFLLMGITSQKMSILRCG